MNPTQSKQPYGLIREADLTDPMADLNDLHLGQNTWAVAETYREEAKDHCAALLITNLALYFSRQGYGGLLINDHIDDTFREVYRMVGDGPIPMTADKAKKYFLERGYRLKTRPVMTYRRLKKAIDLGRPLGLLLTESWNHWHWVLAVGYRKTVEKGKYIHVVDGWHARGNQYYQVHKGSFWWSATEYALTEIPSKESETKKHESTLRSK